MLIVFNQSKAQNFMQNGRQGYPNTIYHPSNFAVGFGTDARNMIDESALIEMQATDKGLLIPRMTEAEMQAIPNPANSLMVYNTTDSTFKYYDEKSDNWQEFASEKGISWTTNGEDEVTCLTNQSFFVGVGTCQPQRKLHIFSQTDNSVTADKLAAIRLDNLFKGKINYTWDIENNDENLNLIYSLKKGEEYTEEPETKFVFNKNSRFGIGTAEPATNLHIYKEEEPIIRIEGLYDDGTAPGGGGGGGNSSKQIKPVNWDIRLDENRLRFDYQNQKNKITFFGDGTIKSKGSIAAANNIRAKTFRNSNKTFKVSQNGVVTAHKFIGDGSQLTNLPFPEIPEPIWQSPENSNNIFYNNGNVSIGTTTSIEKLTVDGKILATDEIIVDMTGLRWEDRVFEENYDLMPINELNTFITQNHHLPNIPTEAEIIETGLETRKIITLQMQKIEELTHIIHKSKSS